MLEKGKILNFNAKINCSVMHHTSSSIKALASSQYPWSAKSPRKAWSWSLSYIMGGLQCVVRRLGWSYRLWGNYHWDVPPQYALWGIASCRIIRLFSSIFV